jgi:hypothetical protein
VSTAVAIVVAAVALAYPLHLFWRVRQGARIESLERPGSAPQRH